MPPAVPRLSLVCAQCGATFERRAKELARHPASGTYCSMRCRGLSMRNRVTLTCGNCGTAFERAAAEAARHGGAFCGWKCFKANVQDGATSYPKRGRVHEHRIIGAELVGRPLLPHEVVHHKDENRRNNSPENLEVTDRPSHARHHRLGKIVTEETRARLRAAAQRRRQQP